MHTAALAHALPRPFLLLAALVAMIMTTTVMSAAPAQAGSAQSAGSAGSAGSVESAEVSLASAAAVVAVAALMVPNHYRRNSRNVRYIGVRLGMFTAWPYVAVKVTRERSYRAQKMIKLGRMRLGAAAICTIASTLSPWAGATCVAAVFLMDSDFKNALRGVRANHHRCFKYTRYRGLAADIRWGNWSAPLCTYR